MRQKNCNVKDNKGLLEGARKIIGEHKWLALYIGIGIVTALLNILAWNSTDFCDAYIAYVFPIWVNTYGRLTGLLPFSLGEWMIAAGVILVLAAVLLVPAAVLLRILKASGRAWGRFVRGFYLFFAWVLMIVCLVMTLNCMILYHASTFSEKYFGEDKGEAGLTALLSLRNYVVTRCNQLSEEVLRDDQGNILYEESANEAGDIVEMGEKAVEIMQALGKTYPQLDGYYPTPKPLMSSDFMCQQYMQGYYFPFSMEANYNDVMYIMNIPSTMCHELAHLRGYIFEDEANFISYLACIQAEDIYFQYSGYLSVLNYLENDVYRASRSNEEDFARAVAQEPLVQRLDQVHKDNIFVTEENWERINSKAIIDTETVDELSDIFIDTTLKVNGVSDGSISYSRVVRLLLQYYELYPLSQEK